MKVCVNKRKRRYFVRRRVFPPVQDTYKCDIIWIIWEILLDIANNKSTITYKVMEALLKIFCIKYKPGTKRKRRYLLYFAVSLITENVDYTIEMISNKENIDVITSKIDIIYRQIKKNEVSPKTDYLFNNVDKTSNLKKTIEKLDKLKSLNGLYYSSNDNSKTNTNISDDEM